jgi:hypothetical protein
MHRPECEARRSYALFSGSENRGTRSKARSDFVRPRIAGEVRLLQEVDIGSSAEITLGARLMQLSAHEKTAAFSFINRSAR